MVKLSQNVSLRDRLMVVSAMRRDVGMYSLRPSPRTAVTDSSAISSTLTRSPLLSCSLCEGGRHARGECVVG